MRSKNEQLAMTFRSGNLLYKYAFQQHYLTNATKINWYEPQSLFVFDFVRTTKKVCYYSYAKGNIPLA